MKIFPFLLTSLVMVGEQKELSENYYSYFENIINESLQ